MGHAKLYSDIKTEERYSASQWHTASTRDMQPHKNKHGASTRDVQLQRYAWCVRETDNFKVRYGASKVTSSVKRDVQRQEDSHGVQI